MILILIVLALAGALVFREFPKHPRALPILFFAEMWERFSFYGMRALLILYMTKELAYDDGKAYGVYGAYGALVYATPVLGGLIADRLLGNRGAILLGGLLMALGHFIMAVQHEVAFYSALALLILGNGFFKPNVSSLVGKLYPQGDPRRDGGFTIFYMGINLGAFLAPLLCGAIGEKFGMHYGFGLAGVGMCVGLYCFWQGGKTQKFEEHGLPPDIEGLHRPRAGGLSLGQWVPLIALLLVPVVAALVRNNSVLEFVVPILALTVLVIMVTTALRSPPVERDRLLTLIVLFFASVTFWAFFEQAGSSLTLFTDRNVNRQVPGWLATLLLFLTEGKEVPASVFQSVNALMIVALAPVFSILWVALSKRGWEPSTPAKFALSLVQIGVGFYMLVFGARFVGPDFREPLIFLVLAYLCHTTGELCSSPVGLSTVTKLAPERMVSFVMGFWFLSSSVAHFIASHVAKLTAVHAPSGQGVVSAAQSLPVYTGVFFYIAVVSVGASLVMFALTPLLRRWMHGVH